MIPVCRLPVVSLGLALQDQEANPIRMAQSFFELHPKLPICPKGVRFVRGKVLEYALRTDSQIQVEMASVCFLLFLNNIIAIS
jgi:hypothetical protein